jgi:hypothetical protein
MEPSEIMDMPGDEFRASAVKQFQAIFAGCRAFVRECGL